MTEIKSEVSFSPLKDHQLLEIYEKEEEDTEEELD
jgi:hypothetical protein